MRLPLIVCSILLVLMIDTAHGGSRVKISSRMTTSPSVTSSTASKTNEKMAYPKKVTSLKKRPTKSRTTEADITTLSKKPTDVTAAFKDLPKDDMEFIEALDEQFKLHGDKIKIKVEHDNSTEIKNPKRTIEGDLGYGYAQNGYEYTRPKFMFYPYSQEDIPASAPGYYPKYEATSVTIEPSYSYELKPQTYEVAHDEPQIDLPHAQEAHDGAQQGPKQYHGQQYDEPVIILRIPGPTKYATHLQTLLQQYLEIRAAQYLRILEEAELRKQQQYHHADQQQQVEYEQPHVNYEQPPQPEALPEGPQMHYHQQVVYTHQAAAAVQQDNYPDIDDVYQSYKGRHQQQQQQQQHQQQHQQQQQQQQHQYQQQHQHQHAEPQAPAQHAQPPQQQLVSYYSGAQSYAAPEVVPQYYYTPEQQYVQAGVPETQQQYQNLYFITMTHDPYYSEQQPAPEQQLHQQPIYVPEEQAAAHEHVPQHQHHTEPIINENNPRKTHTKVIFTQNNKQNLADESPMYPLPLIRPFERHAPTSTPLYHQNYQHQQQQEQHTQQHEAQSSSVNEEAYQPQPSAGAGPQPISNLETVAITQKPFNYHARSSKGRGRTRAIKRGASRTAGGKTSMAVSSSVEDDTHLQKIREYVRDNLGAQMGSAVEFKTTKAVKV